MNKVYGFQRLALIPSNGLLISVQQVADRGLPYIRQLAKAFLCEEAGGENFPYDLLPIIHARQYTQADLRKQARLAQGAFCTPAGVLPRFLRIARVIKAPRTVSDYSG